MKYIKRIPSIELRDPTTGASVGAAPLSHEGYVNGYPLNDKRFGTDGGFKAIMAGSKVQAAFRGDSAEIALEDADYAVLRDCIESPQPIAGAPLSPEMARQYSPFMAEILDAKDKPESKAKAAKRAKKAKTPPKSAEAESMN